MIDRCEEATVREGGILTAVSDDSSKMARFVLLLSAATPRPSGQLRFNRQDWPCLLGNGTSAIRLLLSLPSLNQPDARQKLQRN